MQLNVYATVGLSYLGPLGAAVHSGEDIVGVHGTEHEGRSIPGCAAVHTAECPSWTPALQTGHAHRREVLRPPLQLHLHTDHMGPLILTQHTGRGKYCHVILNYVSLKSGKV
jgi:hypothetical protein